MPPDLPLRRSSRLALGCLALGLGLGLAGCATTQIVESWTAPGLTPQDLHFEHVAAIAVMPDSARQRIVEDALVRSDFRTKVTPGYQILSPQDRPDPARVRKVLEQNGIDGAVTVSLVGVDEKQTYVPGSTHAGGFYGYYGMRGAVYDPGYVRTDKYVVVETSLYDVKSGKLLWSGTSKTLNPKDSDALIAGVVKAARKQLHDDGLLP